jgi:hypothetical protein
MKKWGILLSIVAVICIVSEVMAESKRLEEPVVLDVVMDFNFSSTYVSFLTNNQKPAVLQSIEIDGKSYNPEPASATYYADGTRYAYSFAKYRYYSIYNSIHFWEDEEWDELLEMAESLKRVKLYFQDDPKGYEADLLTIMPEEERLFSLYSDPAEEGKMNVRVDILDTVTLTAVNIYEKYGKVDGIFKNGEAVSLPAVIEPGNHVEVHLSGIQGLYDYDQAYLQFTGTAKQKDFTTVIGVHVNEPASAAWVTERVGKYLE